MKLFLCPNGFTDTQARQAVHCLSVLEDACGHSCSLSAKDSEQLYKSSRRATFSPAESDMILSLGGDGSVLRAAQIAITHDKPLMGINSGRLGYLCALGYDSIGRFNEIIQLCHVSQRTLLEFVYDRNTHYAVNDVVIAKSSFGATVDLSVQVGRTTSLSVRGDGLIIATPTGSTGYTLSAGGAVLEPSLPAIELTPICPHGLDVHPQIIDDKKQIAVSERNSAAQIIADGANVGKLSMPLRIFKSRKCLRLCVRSDVGANS